MNTVRKNITMPISDYEVILAHAKRCGLNFSAFLRQVALKEIAQSEKMSLLEYLNENSAFVDKQEQQELDALNLDFSSFDGREISLDELLQG